ncbi:hypothetical protein ANCDUO_09943 [Ancylostoma duodenale]|uniref:Uncharacterized protein n=1 Tax=Ancylostoma duodenale TaxID=51022 RepID=A0A0C2GF79_9BILA|nr:hypothetical protein ANCDUO_09943 [Ancylostoma duodenale]
MQNSPAAEGGLMADDLIIQYGMLHADNFKDMKEVSATTAKHEGSETISDGVLDFMATEAALQVPWLRKYEHLIGGFAGGVASTAVCHPMDLLKIRYSGM